MGSQGKTVKISLIFALVFTLFATAGAGAAPAARKTAVKPYADLVVSRNDKTGVVVLTLQTHGKKGGDVKVVNTISDGVTQWENFIKWYEDLFALAYMDSNYDRMWKQLRKRGVTMGEKFISQDMLKAINGVSMLVVVDDVYPFPADTFRFGDKWFFEIAPIVHSRTKGPKDVSDDYKYKSALVLDCQGPKDREGLEAPGVFADLSKIDGIGKKMILSMKKDETIKNLEKEAADILHLATHAHPDEFFPGRNKPGIPAAELAEMKMNFRTILSTGCHTGSPLFASGVLHGKTRFLIASMYTTSGKDGIVLGRSFYPLLFAGKSPFESFYEVKKSISGDKSDFPDILRFVFFVK